MPYIIEVLSIGDDQNAAIAVAAKTLNAAQSEFHFVLPPPRLLDKGLLFVREEYRTSEVFEFLREYRESAKGHRPFLIAIASRQLNSEKWVGILGSHEAKEGLAVVTLNDEVRIVGNRTAFLCYYLIRYGLSFVEPELKTHLDTRSCFFDFKEHKPDLKKSLQNGSLCDACRAVLENRFNEEIRTAFEKMIVAMRAALVASTMDRTVTWLHLSDLHLCPPKTGWDADFVLEKLQADLRRLEEQQNLIPDLLFFTGDIAYGDAGTRPGEPIKDQFDAAQRFLDEVRSSFSIPISVENTFLIPGNHDISRAQATPDQSAWLDNQTDVHAINNLIRTNNVQWQRYMQRLAPYEEFLRKSGYAHLLADPSRLIYALQREVRGVKIGIAGLNTAWSCCRDGEKGRLWCGGEWQIGQLRSQLKGTRFNVALMHHPVNWLVEHEDPRLERVLEQNFQFHLHGHEHQGWVRPFDEFTRIAAAACYDRSDRENGYNIVRINVDRGFGEVWLRKYDRDGGGWIRRSIHRKAEDGVWPLTQLPWLAQN